MVRYYLQGRDRFGGWEAIPGEEFDDPNEACLRALSLSDGALSSNECRVVDRVIGGPVVTFENGGRDDDGGGAIVDPMERYRRVISN